MHDECDVLLVYLTQHVDELRFLVGPVRRITEQREREVCAHGARSEQHERREHDTLDAQVTNRLSV